MARQRHCEENETHNRRHRRLSQQFFRWYPMHRATQIPTCPRRRIRTSTSACWHARCTFGSRSSRQSTKASDNGFLVVSTTHHTVSLSLSLSLSLYTLSLYISPSLSLLLYPSFAPAPAPRWPLNQSVSSIVYPSGTHPCNKHWSAKNSLSDAGLEPPRHMAMHNLTKCDPVKVALCDHGQDNSKRAPGGPRIIAG